MTVKEPRDATRRAESCDSESGAAAPSAFFMSPPPPEKVIVARGVRACSHAACHLPF